MKQTLLETLQKKYGHEFNIQEVKNLSIKELLVLLCADIEIFLTLDDDQETLKDKLYTAEEINNQLYNSISKLANVLRQQGYNIDKPIQP